MADFTYVWTLAGFVYVSFLVDVFSRRILGWRVMASKHTPLVNGVVEQALFTRRRTVFNFTATGLVHHSDAGSAGRNQPVVATLDWFTEPSTTAVDRGL